VVGVQKKTVRARESDVLMVSLPRSAEGEIKEELLG